MLFRTSLLKTRFHNSCNKFLCRFILLLHLFVSDNVISSLILTYIYVNVLNIRKYFTAVYLHCRWASVAPGHCCYRIGPICFLAGWRKRRTWTRVSLVSLVVIGFLCCVLFQLALFVWITLPSNWLARPYPMKHFVDISTKTRLHEGPLTFKQSSSYELFWCFHYSFSYCYFLVNIFIMIILSQLSNSLTF